MPTDDLNQRVQHSPACVYLYNSEHRSPPVSHVPLGGPGCICNVPAESDLNQRVQERLAEMERFASNTMPRGPVADPIGYVVWKSPTTMGPIVDSWRERWERHQPLRGIAVCGTCAHPIDRPPGGPPVSNEHLDLCDDAVALCREIGVEP